MAETTTKRLAVVAKELGVGTSTIIEHLHKNGFEVDNKPTTKVTEDQYKLLLRDFQKDKNLKEKAEQISLGKTRRENLEIDERETISIKDEEEQDEVFVKNLGPQAEKPAPPAEEKPSVKETPVAKQEPKEEKTEAKEAPKEEAVSEDKKGLAGPKVIGKIDLEPKVKKKEEPKAPEKPKAEETKPVAKEEPKVETPKKEEPSAPKVPVAKEEPKEEKKQVEKPAAKAPEPKEEESQTIETKKVELQGPKVVGKIDLPDPDRGKKKKPVASSSEDKPTEKKKKRRRKRIKPEGEKDDRQQRPPFDRDRRGGKGGGRRPQERDQKDEISEKEIEEKIKATMAKLSGGGGGGSSKGKAAKKVRRTRREAEAEELAAAEGDKQILQLTEFISVAEMASLMSVSVSQVISTCMNLGIIVSINQRLDAEVIELVADEFGFEVEFINVSEQEEEEIDEDDPEDLVERAPIVTIMGHVDHGKTSLLDYIRSTNVIAGEMGGITQHIGAYEVVLEDGRTITFLDTPGHEAFTAMRARGAKLTDIAVIVIAADDAVMPQTKEAISHAQAAGVPLIFAINKVDKPDSNPEKIKEQLAGMNLLVEDWGGKYQSQEISAKTGMNVDNLMDKILLEAELLELKANPDKNAIGSVVEAELDRGRGYVSTILVQEGTLRVGDVMVAGSNFGKVKALHNERGQKVKEAGPSTPVQVLGLDGAPQAGEKFKVYDSEQEAKAVATKRAQIEREQGLRAQKHITLDEIGRRLALGNFQQLNVIVKGDVDGSVEALSDSLLKLSTEEIQVAIIHKGVGQITESDVLLASASDAIILGFQVRPSLNARKLAEKESIEIRMYSIIYDAIDEIRSAMEGMLQPKIEEKIVSNVEVRDVFKISKVGTIAGCYVLEGKLTRNTRVRIIRDGIVIKSGELASLKRFKDDVKEVRAGMECGLNIKDFNDIKVGDIIEGFEEVQVKRTL